MFAMINAEKLQKLVKEFVKLQLLILALFKKQFPQAKDWNYLLDFPSTGQLKIANDMWVFHKHGVGLRFESSRGTIVDIHSRISEPDILDAWRLLQFLESKKIVEEGQIGERDLDELLETLVVENILESASEKKREYRIS